MRRNMGLVLAIFSVLVFLAFSVGAEAQEVGVSADSIKIGVFVSLTGPGSVYGIPVRSSTDLVFNEVNQAGGINGRKIEWIVEDDNCSGTKAIAAIKKLITRDKVFALFGGNCSNSTVNVLPLAIEEKVPLYVAMAGTSKIVDPFNHYVFRSNINNTLEGRAMVDFAMDEFKPKRVAQIYQTEEYGIDSSTGAEKRLKEKHNMDLVTKEAHKLGDTDFSSQVLKVKEAKPDIVLLHTYLQSAAIILRQANELGLKAIFVASIAASHPGIIDQLAGKEAVNGKYFAVTPLMDDVDGEKLKPFKEKYIKAYPVHSQRPGVPGMYEAQGYGSANTFVEGLRRAGKNLTRESLIKALETLNDFDSKAFTPITFTSADHDGTRGIYFYKFTEDGKRIFINKFYVYKDTK